jgi:hypothetical protein
MSQTSDTIAQDLALATSAASTIVQLVPAIAPYAAAIDLALALAQKVAPPLYDEIVNLIERIKDGGAPTDADLAALRAMIAQLKNPDSYFADTLAEIKALLVAQVAKSALTIQAAQPVTVPEIPPVAASPADLAPAPEPAITAAVSVACAKCGQALVPNSPENCHC